MVEPLPKCAKLWGSTSSTTHTMQTVITADFHTLQKSPIPYSFLITFLKSKRIILDFKATSPLGKVGQRNWFCF